jgi:hypothetical protein
VRNEEECVCSVCLLLCNIFIGVRLNKEVPGLVASGTLCIYIFIYLFVQGVQGVKVTSLGFNSRVDSESKSHTHTHTHTWV